MKLESYQYRKDSGWSRELDKSLDSDNTVVIVFGSPVLDAVSNGLEELKSSFQQSVILGCSSSGEIYQDDVLDFSLSVSVIQFESTTFKFVSESLNEHSNSYDVGKSLADDVSASDIKSVLVLSDGLSVNGSQLVRGLSDTLPEGTVITGGLAGDGDRFEKTWVLNNGDVRFNEVTALALYGPAIEVGHGSRGGWDVLGPTREVTKSQDNILYELDGQPALELYKKYLGELAEGLPATGLRFPLAIENDEDGVDDTVRTILAVNEDEHSITFAGDIPKGANVRLMRANYDRLIDGASGAAEAIDMSRYNNGPILAISISCVGRRLVLGPRTEEEIDAAVCSFPENTQNIGFYSYGEISPLASGKCDLHNQTMTITLLWES